MFSPGWDWDTAATERESHRMEPSSCSMLVSSTGARGASLVSSPTEVCMIPSLTHLSMRSGTLESTSSATLSRSRPGGAFTGAAKGAGRLEVCLTQPDQLVEPLHTLASDRPIGIAAAVADDKGEEGDSAILFHFDQTPGRSVQIGGGVIRDAVGEEVSQAAVIGDAAVPVALLARLYQIQRQVDGVGRNSFRLRPRGAEPRSRCRW